MPESEVNPMDEITAIPPSAQGDGDPQALSESVPSSEAPTEEIPAPTLGTA